MDNRYKDHGPTSWAETLAGIALFLIMAAFLILEEIPLEWELGARIQTRVVMFWTFMLLPPAGLALGWMRNFPRWSYPYVGMAVVIGLYMTNASSPGISLFGIPLFGRELWGWRALVPLTLACLAGLLVTRSFCPLAVLIGRTFGDLTLITYTLFGGLPLWVFASFDEMDRRCAFSWMVVLGLLMVVTALAYLRSRTPWGRVASLTAGILLSLAITTAVPILYWLENGWVDIGGSIAFGAFLAAIMLLPAFFGLTRQAAGSV